jgi:hypothetical protein
VARDAIVRRLVGEAHRDVEELRANRDGGGRGRHIIPTTTNGSSEEWAVSRKHRQIP